MASGLSTILLCATPRKLGQAPVNAVGASSLYFMKYSPITTSSALRAKPSGRLSAPGF